MATKWRPARSPATWVIRLQKKRSIDATSTVPPLLLATMNQVRSGVILAAAVVSVDSSVVSTTTSCGKPVATP